MLTRVGLAELTKTDLAKYPFLAEATDYVRDMGFSIDDIAAPEFGSVLDRAERRLEEALSSGQVSVESSNDSAEILSFPLSNMLLSLIGDERARRRFSLGEAKRAYELLRHESPEKIQHIATTTFGWRVAKIETKLGMRFYDFGLSMIDFLRNSVYLREPRWTLPNRILDHGFVFITREEAARLLEEEIRVKILERSGRVPNTIPPLFELRVERVRVLVVKWLGLPTHYELPKVPVPEAMPPCIRHLMDNLNEGKNVQHMGRFALAAFLLNIGVAEDEIVKMFKPATDFSERMTRYQVEHIGGKRGGRTKYTCPKCATLKTHGVCYMPDEICSTIGNPLGYYKKKSRILLGRGPKREFG